MSDAFHAGIAEITSNLVREGITSQVYTSFVNALCEAAGRSPQNDFEVTDERCHTTVQCQESMGREAIIRGFHHIAWTKLLRETWVPPKKDRNGKRIEKRRDPLQQAVLLIRNTWSLFNRLWECRNSILHSNESRTAEREEEATTESLLDFKRNNLVKLRRCDRFLIDNYEESDIIKWHPPRKQAVLALMTRLHKIFVIEEKNAAPEHRNIRDYFAPISATTGPAPEALVTQNSFNTSCGSYDVGGSAADSCADSSDETPTVLLNSSMETITVVESVSKESSDLADTSTTTFISTGSDIVLWSDWCRDESG